MKTSVNFLLCLVAVHHSVAMSSNKQPKIEYAGLSKISDDLYTGKVNDSFYLAMERVGDKNVDDWYGYAQNQQERITAERALDPGGVEYFERVIESYKYMIIKPQNEVWVAYASDKKVQKKAQLKDSDDVKHIEMFVTVITTPEALLTTHMGISRSYEAAIAANRVKQPNQSMHLHSFAAKVMKQRYPNKVYMMTAPMDVMRSLFIKNLPADSIFLGDDSYQKEIEIIEKDHKKILTAEQLKRKTHESDADYEKRIKDEAQELYKSLKIKEKMAWLKTNPPRIAVVIDKNLEYQKFTIYNPDGKELVAFDKTNPNYQWIFTPILERGYDIDAPFALVKLPALADWGKLQS